MTCDLFVLLMCMIGVFGCFVAYLLSCSRLVATRARVVSLCVCNGMTRCVFAGARFGSPAAEEAIAHLVAMQGGGGRVSVSCVFLA